MHYHFLGNAECPSWLLEELCTNFASMTVLKFKELCKRASDYAITGHDKPVLGDTSDGINIANPHKDILFISNWLLLKAAGHDCPPEDLQQEVEQLGLPKEHSEALKHVYAEHKNELMEKTKRFVHREENATVSDTSATSFTMQTSDQTYTISMAASIMNQLKNDVENSVASMKDLAEMLPSRRTSE